MKHLIQEDEVVLWKSATVRMCDDKIMLLLYYYHTSRTDKSKTFYKCNVRIDTEENWKRIRNELIENNPAMEFRTSMIGLNDDYRMFYSRKMFNRADMYSWLGSKFSDSKIRTFDEFIKDESDPGIKEPFLLRYIIEGQEINLKEEPGKIPEGLWFSSLKEKKQNRKKYGNIVL